MDIGPVFLGWRSSTRAATAGCLQSCWLFTLSTKKKKQKNKKKQKTNKQKKKKKQKKTKNK
jgi:hypothetical protein